MFKDKKCEVCGKIMRNAHKKQKYCQDSKCAYEARVDREKRLNRERAESGLRGKPRINLPDIKVAEVVGITNQTIINYKNSEKESVQTRYDVLRMGVLMKILGYDFETLKSEIELNSNGTLVEKLAEGEALYYSQVKKVREVVKEVKERRK